MGKLSFILALFISISANATTYYVSPSGNNTTGTSLTSAFQTIQKCVDIAVEGDICLVGDGTYSDTDGNGVTVYLNKNSGTSTKPITLKSINPFGAKIIIPNVSGTGNHAIHVDRNYWIIDGFDISGSPANATSISGISIWYAVGTKIINSRFHDIGYNICNLANYGFTGVFVAPGASNTLVENNIFHSIGRLHNLDGKGCSWSVSSAGDHGIYAEAPFTNLRIQRNLFYNVVRGWPIHVYNSIGATADNIHIYNNTFADKSIGGAAGPAGHIVLARAVTNVYVKNNLSYNAYIGMLRCSSMTGSNVVVENNLSDTGIQTGECPSWVSYSTSNKTNVLNLGLASPSTRNYTLLSDSPAIDFGQLISGISYLGLRPDAGTFESGSPQTSTKPLAPQNLKVQ